jgi:hypothetical protein
VLVTNAANGNVVLNADGSFTYTPNPGFACLDSFTYMANDGAADSNVVTVTINIVDTQGPSLTASVGVPVLWPPNHNVVNVGFGFSTSDNGCGTATAQLDVFSNEPDVPSGGDDSNFSPDAKNLGAGTLRLRAERANAENGGGRVYLIRVSATDSSSNTSSNCVTVVVPSSNSPKAVNDAKARGLAAATQCTATGLPPAGYVPVGVGAVIGPK